MRTCPYCAEQIEEQAQVCPFCTTDLPAPLLTSASRQSVAPGVPPPSLSPGNSITSGKAIASLICGVLFFFLPSAIVAIVMGHLSLSDIRRSAGRLGGRGMGIAGLVLGYLGLSVLPILIIAAIAIPNLLHSKIAANEASAVGSLRTISVACTTYQTQYGSYPSTLATLGPSAHPTAQKAGLIDETVASGRHSGYFLTYEAGPSQGGVASSYEVHADPITPATTGIRHFFVDETGVIRVSERGPATADSPPI